VGSDVGAAVAPADRYPVVELRVEDEIADVADHVLHLADRAHPAPSGAAAVE
jgi:hypothetical protein